MTWSKDVSNVLSGKGLVLTCTCCVEGQALEAIRLAEGLLCRRQHGAGLHTGSTVAIVPPSAEQFALLRLEDPRVGRVSREPWRPRAHRCPPGASEVRVPLTTAVLCSERPALQSPCVGF